MERCRLCARESSELLSITVETEKKIGRLMPVVVFLGDLLPQAICCLCQTRLDEYSFFCDQAKRAERYFLPNAPCIENDKTRITLKPMVKLHDIYEEVITVAYKSFMNINQPDPLASFDKNTISATPLFSCKMCKCIYVSENAALAHICSRTNHNRAPLIRPNGLSINNAPEPERPKTPPVVQVNTEPLQKSSLQRPPPRQNGQSINNVPEPERPKNHPVVQINTEQRQKTSLQRLPPRKRKRRRTVGDGNTNKCHICGLIYQNETEFRIHFEMHFDGPHNSTNVIVNEPKALDGHSVKRYICEICHQSFTRKSALLTHHEKTHAIEGRSQWSDDGF